MQTRRFHPARRHAVYVVLLAPSVRDLELVRRLNPGANESKPCIYVGMTGLSPEERFARHKAGRKASRWVRDFGLKLLPEMYAHLNPLTRERAAELEAFLAEAFRKQGYTVLGGH